MGIDQVLVIPTMVIMNLPFAENADGVEVFCRAYNDWCHDWCAEVPRRLFGAGAAARYRTRHGRPSSCAESPDAASRSALIRPIDARGAYPNDIGAVWDGGGPGPMDELFRTFEETGVVLGMHTFPAGVQGRTAGPGLLASPGQLVNHAGADSQALSFIFEMHDWLAQVLLGGFLDRYPRLKMAVFESNSSWLPYLLETCDRLFQPLRQRATGEERPSAVRGLLRPVRDLVRVGRGTDDGPVGPVRRRRRVGVRLLPPRWCRCVERHPRHARDRGTRGHPGSAHGGQRQHAFTASGPSCS